MTLKQLGLPWSDQWQGSKFDYIVEMLGNADNVAVAELLSLIEAMNAPADQTAADEEQHQVTTELPRALALVVGDVLGGYYFHHQTIEVLFHEVGARTPVPEGNCKTKVSTWLIQEGKEDLNNALSVMGKSLEEFMDTDILRHLPDKTKDQKRIQDMMRKFGLSYSIGGRVIGASIKAPSKALREKLSEWSVSDLDVEFDRALRQVESDPPAAVTAACALVESLCKKYIAEVGLELPTKQTVIPLWRVVSKSLGLRPEDFDSDDLKRVLSGLSSIVDGVGAFRTHEGSAHGHSGKNYRIASRHARLVVHSAHTLALFILETWEARAPKANKTLNRST